MAILSSEIIATSVLFSCIFYLLIPKQLEKALLHLTVIQILLEGMIT